MKKLILVYFMAISAITGLAQSIDVKFSSDKAVVNDQVTAIIKIATDSDIEPTLSLDPVNAEIVQQEFQGLSTSTIYNNGELTTKREFVFSVTIQPKSIGRAGLTNIAVDFGGKTVRHPSAWINVSNERAERNEPVFLLVQPSKTRAFHNEGILVRYYLLTQVDLASVDIKEFPKLNNFVKRYLQEQGTRERVAYEGQQYIRQLLYSVVVFPEKAKSLKIDPMKVQVAYDAQSGHDPFSMGSGRLVSKLISSKSTEIEVLNIPTEQLPTGFTGLVGKHKFSLTVNKTKVLTNEPIEIKLKVTGTGNLEGAEPPEIIKDSSFESFDTNSSLDILDSVNATKTFEYTYLPRKETTIPAQKIPLSFFNPDTQQFETVDVDFPGIEVVGGVYQNQSSSPNDAPAPVEKTSTESMESKIAKMVELPKMSGPIFDPSVGGISMVQILNFMFMSLVLITLFLNIYKMKEDLPWKKSSSYLELYKSIEARGLNYSGLEELLLKYPKVDLNLSLKSKINQLDLPTQTKSNLVQLVDKLDKGYSKDSAKVLPTVEWKSYKSDLKKLTQVLETWEKKEAP